MNAKAIYERIMSEAELPQDKFIYYFNDVTMYLENKYRRKYLFPDDAPRYQRLQNIEDSVSIADEYEPAYIFGILYYATGNEKYHVQFVQSAEDAYKSIWSEKRDAEESITGGGSDGKCESAYF